MSLLENPIPILATLFIILIGKSLAAFLIMRAFGHPVGTALTISASLAQIGEFSFILAALGVQLDLLPEAGRDLILTGALLSIVLNPLAFASIVWLQRRIGGAAQAEPRTGDAPPTAEHRDVPTAAPAERDDIEPPVRTTLTGHLILVGYGRVGSRIGQALLASRRPFLVIEDADAVLPTLRAAGIETIPGNAAQPAILSAANPAAARALVVAITDAFEAGQVVEQARSANPALQIITCVQSDAEAEHLSGLGANVVLSGEREIARGVMDEVDRRFPPPNGDRGTPAGN